MKIKSGQIIKMYELVTTLINLGYESVSEIVMPGQFSRLGGTLEIFTINNIATHRVDFFGEEIESIKRVGGDKIDELDIKKNYLVLDDKSNLMPGDFVVHENHGVGIFKTLGVKKVGKNIKEYLFIEYLNNDYLYLPINLKGKITKYIGVGRRTPKLNKLGTQTWQKNRKKVYENMLILARELLQIYSKREIAKKTPYKIKKEWESELKKTFGFVETQDQEKAINETYADLSSGIPMDRLICGDVGFGKTEVALRAALQAIANGHQVALLCPTTILAEQHSANIKRRFDNLPIDIATLSRFYSESEQKRSIDKIKSGSVDIVVGTHRILGSDITFKNLDLLIIDEEQRFGVKQKEALKKLRSKINVLTLTATPIPRTLFMAISGIRDISNIESAPSGRKGIETEVKKYDEVIIDQYINRERKRNGQVYYLSNKVAAIAAKASSIKRRHKEKVIEVAHGQMDEKSLAEVMRRFIEGKIDILVCSTIIENGLDLPNVNTLIVEDADKFGLSQLYQIRGRIGRSPRQAYCLLTHSEKKLTDNAYKRLKSITENQTLGSGFNIALSDLEIRGGGNILGREQHGAMEQIGLILYSKMLKGAVDGLIKHERKNAK
jgi:transcription-repair coupling factor (superfamily II helicase)